MSAASAAEPTSVPPQESVDDYVAGALAELRVARGLSPEKFARELAINGYEVSMSTVSHIETRRVKTIGLAYVLAVCDTFRVTLRTLLPCEWFGVFVENERR